MDRQQALKDSAQSELFDNLQALHDQLDTALRAQYNRSLPLGDELIDRWKRAKSLGFGEESSIYDSSYVFGNVTVGRKTWIGPFTIIDGSGGLTIGESCTISAGVQIYTHDNVAQTLTGHLAEIERSPVAIGSFTYIGPNAVIKRGITIGDHCVIAAGSFINENVSPYSIVAGLPGKKIGTVEINGAKVSLKYAKE